jgi:hypothetical protein
MALFLREQVAQFYSVRVVKGKDGNDRHYADIGFLSSSKVKGSDDYASDQPLYISAFIKGQEAQKLISATEAKALLSLTFKIYSYTVDKGGKKERRDAWEILQAQPFIPKAKSASAEQPTFTPADELADLPF